MRRTSLVRFWLVISCLSGLGCSDNATDVATATPAKTSSASTATPDSTLSDATTPDATSSSPKTTGADSGAAGNPSSATAANESQPVAKPAVVAEVSAKEVAPPPEPTTAAAALAVVDLEALPKSKIKQQFTSNPMSLYYSTEGSIASVNEATLKMLSAAGWKETKHLVTSTNEYVDRLLTKEGHFMRLTISTGSTRDEMAVNMTVLGNFDVRSLPLTKDADVQESTPVMAGHLSRLSIPDAYDDLTKRMTDLGWQMVHDFNPPMEEVPHYRAVHFRKNAVRVHLGFVKNPTNPAQTNIFYHAESVMPLDVPMIDPRQPVQFDADGNRAKFPWQGDRSAMVELLTKHSKEFGWQFVNADDFVESKISVLYISLGTPVGIAARLVESAGVYSITMDRVKLPNKKDAEASAEANKLAQAKADEANSRASKQMKADIDKQFAETDAAVTKAVNDEISKALGSLSTGGNKTDLQALQAQAAKLQAQLGGGADSAAAKPADNRPAKKVNILDVPNDDKPLAPEDATIRSSEARIKYGDKTYSLKHCLSYARIEDDRPTKILFFSDKPLLADKLDKLCKSGESFMIYDGFGSDRPDVSLELRISGDNVMINFAADGLSLATNSNDIHSTVRLKDGKVQGRVKLEKPIELRSQPLTFEATIADKVRR